MTTRHLITFLLCLSAATGALATDISTYLGIMLPSSDTAVRLNGDPVDALSNRLAIGLDAGVARLPFGSTLVLTYIYTNAVGDGAGESVDGSSHQAGAGVEREFDVGPGSLALSAGGFYRHDNYDAELWPGDHWPVSGNRSGVLLGGRLSTPLSRHFDVNFTAKAELGRNSTIESSNEIFEEIEISRPSSSFLFAVGIGWRA